MVWKSDVVVDFQNRLVGDLDIIGNNLVLLSGDGATVTGTRIVAIDPVTGKTSWSDSTFDELVPSGDRSFHNAHFVSKGEDIIAVVADGTSGKSAVVRYSTTTRRVVWQFLADLIVLPESLSVSDSRVCFAAEDARPGFALTVSCLDQSGRLIWRRVLGDHGSDWGDVEIALGATRLLVLAQLGASYPAVASFFDLSTGAPLTASVTVGASFGYTGTRHLATWKDDKVIAFLNQGLVLFDLAATASQPIVLASLEQQFPRAPEIAIGGSTAYVMYDLPFPNGGDQPMADVVAAFNLNTGKKLWDKSDAATGRFSRMRPMRLSGSTLLYGDHTGGVWMLAVGSGAVLKHVVPLQQPASFVETLAPLQGNGRLIVSENFGPGPTDYRLAAID